MRKPRKPPTKMTAEIADRAWTIWQKTPIVDELVRQLHLSRDTCVKLAHEGYPIIGIKPLSERLANLNQMAAERADISQAKIKARALRGLWNTALMIEASLGSMAAKLNLERQKAGYDGTQLPAELATMTAEQRFKELRETYKALTVLAGGVDSRMEITGTQAALESFAEMSADWTAEDFANYVKTKKTPEQLKAERKGGTA